MSDKSTILIGKDTIQMLKDSKDHPRQTYDELLQRMAMIYSRNKNQYDEFLHKVQQEKMTELWDNDEDEAWEDA